MKRLLLFVFLLINFCSFGSVKPLPWDEPLKVVKKGSAQVTRFMGGKTSTYAYVVLDIVSQPNCTWGTVQLKIWCQRRVSSPFEQPVRYQWMWVWHSFTAKAEAGASEARIEYYFLPGEDWNYEYLYDSYLEPCY